MSEATNVDYSLETVAGAWVLTGGAAVDGETVEASVTLAAQDNGQPDPYAYADAIASIAAQIEGEA